MAPPTVAEIHQEAWQVQDVLVLLPPPASLCGVAVVVSVSGNPPSNACVRGLFANSAATGISWEGLEVSGCSVSGSVAFRAATISSLEQRLAHRASSGKRLSLRMVCILQVRY